MTSEEIFHLRKEVLKISREEFAELLNVSSQTIVRWENGENSPTDASLSKLTKLSSIVNESGAMFNNIDELLKFAKHELSLLNQEYLENKPAMENHDFGVSSVYAVEEFKEESLWTKISSTAKITGKSLVTLALELFYIMKDPDTPAWAKAVVIGALLYYINPIDAIPDFMPVLGYSDDLAVLGTAMTAVKAFKKERHSKEASELAKKWFHI